MASAGELRARGGFVVALAVKLGVEQALKRALEHLPINRGQINRFVKIDGG